MLHFREVNWGSGIAKYADGETAPLGGGPVDPIPTIDNPND